MAAVKEEVGVPQGASQSSSPYNEAWKTSEARAAQAFTKTRHHPIPATPDSTQTVLSKSKNKDNKSKMKLSSALGFALVLAIILVILTPEVNICLRKEFASGKNSE